MHSRIPATAILAGALLAPLPGAGSAAGAELDRLRLTTVMIEAPYRDEAGGLTDEGGSGVLVCYAEDTAYVLTARHVIYGDRRSTLDLAKIRISFYRDLFPPVEQVFATADDDLDDNADSTAIVAAPAITRTPVQDRDGRELDLLLLAFKPKGSPSLARPGIVPRTAEGFQGGEWRNRPVTAVGWPITKRRADTWAVVSGRIIDPFRAGDLLFHDAEISDGFSGGPLYDDTGALIGINLSEREESRALAIDSVLDAIKLKVPAECSKTWGFRTVEEEIQELADGHYRKAMLALNIKDWDEAVEHLDAAIDRKRSEGGSVHLQGMRFTEYLPHYHLGLALYERARRGSGRPDDYARALKALQVAETQGEIRTHKRLYRRLEVLKDRCAKAIDEQNLRQVKAPGGAKV